ncbi:MAG TPA: LuxR C-terminal-related transcriptional regulator [Puia sp.]|nr:LuxR C-terminal-related transcriptional regulator [Puia sp.]
MLSDTSVLLERINKAISKKWFQKDNSPSVPATEKNEGNSTDAAGSNSLAFLKNSESIQLLEERVVGLERQNNQLLYFINFLIEQLPDLVVNILQGEWEKPGPSDRGEAPGSDNVSLFRSKNLEVDARPYPTPRELDVLELLQKGYCAKEIANRLYISETTVITHKKHLKEKFKAKNTAELISKASSTNEK